jgi:hypothetical protein
MCATPRRNSSHGEHRTFLPAGMRLSRMGECASRGPRVASICAQAAEGWSRGIKELARRLLDGPGLGPF